MPLALMKGLLSAPSSGQVTENFIETPTIDFKFFNFPTLFLQMASDLTNN
jgi:hypothetical protein